MSIEFEELEEPLSRLGSLVVLISSVVITLIAAIGISIINGVYIYGTNAFYVGWTFLFIFIISLGMTIISLLSFVRNWIKYKINVFTAAIGLLILNNLLIMWMPGEPVDELIVASLLFFTWVEIAGIFTIIISKRPKLGKESNKHIYQAYGAVIIIIVGIGIFLLGIYVLVFDIGDFAGNGTFPGESFEKAYLRSGASIRTIYGLLRASGWFLIICAIVVCLASLFRNILSLYIAAVIIFIGIGIGISGLAMFFYNWQDLDHKFLTEFPDEYDAQLTLGLPPIINVGIVLILYMVIGVMMIAYSGQQSEPIQKWKSRRNTQLAAAEVAIRDQKLQKGISYLEKAAIWSSKLGEEDRAVEIITRINNIREKAIKMRKAQAADKKKRELDAAKKIAAKKEATTKQKTPKQPAGEEKKPAPKEEE